MFLLSLTLHDELDLEEEKSAAAHRGRRALLQPNVNELRNEAMGHDITAILW